MKDMGEVLGMTAQGYRSIESNSKRKSLSAKHLYKLAKILKTTPDYLVGRTDFVDHIIVNGEEFTLPAYFIESRLPQDERTKLSTLFARLYDNDNELYNAIMFGLELEDVRYEAFRSIIINTITCIHISEAGLKK